MMSEAHIELGFSGGKTTYTGKVCTKVGTDTKACVGGSVSTQQKGNSSITGRELLGSLETGTVKLTISDEQQVINDANKTTDEYGMMKTQSGNTYIVRGQKGKASFFKCDDLPDTAGGKYKFEITEGGKSLVVSNAKGAKKVCKLSATHE